MNISDDFNKKLREERIRKARAILNHQKFLSAPKSRQDAVINSLLEKDLLPADLKSLITEQKMFTLFDKSLMIRILSDLHPADVLSTCQTDKNFRDFCRDPKMFEFLLRTHYPKAFLTADLRRQYIALTEGIETYYRMYITNFSPFTPLENLQFETPELIDGPTRPEMLSGWKLQHVKDQTLIDLISNRQFTQWLKNDQVNFPAVNKVVRSLILVQLGQSTMFREFEIKLDLFTNWRTYGIHPQVSQIIFRMNDGTRTIDKNFVEYIEEQFKGFVIAFRRRHLPLFADLQRLREEDSLRFLIEEREMEDLTELVERVLQQGKPADLRGNFREKHVLTVKGLEIPEGSKGWLLVHRAVGYSGKTKYILNLYKNKENLVSNFVAEWYEVLYEFLARAQRDATIQRLGVDYYIPERLKIDENHIFIPGTKEVLTPESFYQHLMTRLDYFMSYNFVDNEFTFRPIEF